MFEIQSLKSITHFGKIGLNNRTHKSPEWDGTRCPEKLVSSIGMQHILQMCYEKIKKLSLRDQLR